VRNLICVLFMFLLVSIGLLIPVAKLSYLITRPTRSYEGPESPIVPLNEAAAAPSFNAPKEGYVFVGGQNGSWFQPGQFPRLYQISLQNYSSIQLNPVSSGGTVWGGGFNGSQLLVSGWGSDDDSPGPYVWLYNGAHVVATGSLDDFGQASSWSGGDVFAASYNGKEWLLSGLGSGPLPPYSNLATNHMSLGTFNGSVFTDLSNLVPDQQDAILYANTWNGQNWLVGGGYLNDGVLFAFDGNKTVDITVQARNAIPNFASVQSIAWNGEYWLIGGIGFLAQYDGHKFVDLTQQLEHALKTYNFYSVNAVAWNGQSWLIGGGSPIAQLSPSNAWFASYTSNGFVDLSSALPSYISDGTRISSILGITAVNGMWFIGGYSSNRGILLAYNGGGLEDHSDLVSTFAYVDWVSSLQVLAF